MATRNEWDELQYHNKENQVRKLNDTDANDDGDNNATAHFTACGALHNWARARSPVPWSSSSHSHLAQVRALSALSLHHHGNPCGCYLFDLTSSFYLFTFLLSVFLFPFFHLSDEQQPELNKKDMENLRHSAANGGEDTYDLLYLPTGYEPQAHDFDELQNSSVPLSFKIPAADQAVDDLTLGEMLTEAYQEQVDYFVQEGVSVSQCRRRL